jgi:hypothetical protein
MIDGSFKSVLPEAGSTLPHLLESQGYVVEICSHCKGWGRISGQAWPAYNLYLKECDCCEGTGRIVKQVVVRQQKFNKINSSIELVDEQR